LLAGDQAPLFSCLSGERRKNGLVIVFFDLADLDRMRPLTVSTGMSQATINDRVTTDVAL
jgi:hypothetical protein